MCQNREINISRIDLPHVNDIMEIQVEIVLTGRMVIAYTRERDSYKKQNKQTKKKNIYRYIYISIETLAADSHRRIDPMLHSRLGHIVFINHKRLIDGTSVALSAAITQLDWITGMGLICPRINFLLVMFVIPAEMMHCT